VVCVSIVERLEGGCGGARKFKSKVGAVWYVFQLLSSGSGRCRVPGTSKSGYVLTTLFRSTNIWNQTRDLYLQCHVSGSGLARLVRDQCHCAKWHSLLEQIKDYVLLTQLFTLFLLTQERLRLLIIFKRWHGVFHDPMEKKPFLSIYE
jgi:hypothetical protein